MEQSDPFSCILLIVTQESVRFWRGCGSPTQIEPSWGKDIDFELPWRVDGKLHARNMREIDVLRWKKRAVAVKGRINERSLTRVKNNHSRDPEPSLIWLAKVSEPDIFLLHP